MVEAEQAPPVHASHADLQGLSSKLGRPVPAARAARASRRAAGRQRPVVIALHGDELRFRRGKGLQRPLAGGGLHASAHAKLYA
jgi:hypothetical protein